MSVDKNKPAHDEQTLAKLLEAAYVVQEHNREIRALEHSIGLSDDPLEAKEQTPASKVAKPQSRAAVAPSDYTLTLAQIVETQHHIQAHKLASEEAMTLVAERVIEITRAEGVAIGIVEGKKVRYSAVAGRMTPAKGATVPLEKSLSIACVETSQAFRCQDVDEFLLDPEECRRRGIESMIAAPVFHDGKVAGGLELYYSRKGAFTEQDVHTCQLMAGLITEALVRDEELTWKKSLASERAAMLEALEKLQPNLAALVGHTPAKKEPAVSRPAVQASTQFCRKCGHSIVGEEQFCGQCGTPRSSDYEPPNMQRKVASLWQMQAGRKGDLAAPMSKEDEAEEDLPEDLNELLARASLTLPVQAAAPELFEESESPLTKISEPAEMTELDTELEGDVAEKADEAEKPEEPEEPVTVAIEDTEHAITSAKPTPPANWSSAASARAFWEQLASAKSAPSLIRFWNTRRGDVYLGIAVILVACVLRWGIWSSHSVNVTGTPSAATAHHKSPEADLSLFDRMLIHLGLADPPDAAEDKGNPTVQVWIDTHTGLYYCLGSDVYGKTPKGKFATQREAELDQFQPAYRKACN